MDAKYKLNKNFLPQGNQTQKARKLSEPFSVRENEKHNLEKETN